MLKSYFRFSKSERIVLFCLSGCLCTLIIYSKIGFKISAEKLSVADQSLIRNLEFQVKSDSLYWQTEINFQNKAQKVSHKMTPFSFNPNKLDAETARKLGFSEKQTQIILNFIRKGGRFYKKEDFKKLYCVTDNIYQQIEAYINLEKPNSTSSKVAQKKIICLAVNSADTAQLQQIPGISNYLAKRIIRYRERLGGFFKLTQLLEVYGVDTLKYEQIKSYLIIDASQIRKIKVNRADYKTLIRHPYMDAYLVKSILAYRQQRHTMPDALTLKKQTAMPESLYQKLVPYLDFE